MALRSASWRHRPSSGTSLGAMYRARRNRSNPGVRHLMVLRSEASRDYPFAMSIDAIEIRLARADDAASIAEVHDLAWRNAYRGLIPGRELERMVERRGPRWWRNAIDRKTRIVVL